MLGCYAVLFRGVVCVFLMAGPRTVPVLESPFRACEYEEFAVSDRQ